MIETFVPAVPQILSVVYRCLVLLALHIRASNESMWMEDKEDNTLFTSGNRAYIESWHWLISTGLSQHLTPKEEAKLSLPFGQWSWAEAMNTFEGASSAYTFLWMLGWEDELPRVSGLYGSDPGEYEHTITDMKYFLGESSLLCLNSLVEERNIQLAYARRLQLQLAYLQLGDSGNKNFGRKGIETLMCGVKAANLFPDSELSDDLPEINQINLGNPNAVRRKYLDLYFQLRALDWTLGLYPDWDQYPHPNKRVNLVWMKP